MRSNKVSFFRVLAHLEDMILTDDSFPASEKEVLCKLIQFIEDGKYSNSKNRRFVGKNFRLSTESMCQLWNATHLGHQKSLKTFYSQVSSYSQDMYKLFALDYEGSFSDIFVLKDTERIQKISDMIDALSLSDEVTNHIFVSELEQALNGVVCDENLAVEDCSNEIGIMKQLTKDYVAKMLARADISKMAFIKSKMDKSIFYTKAKGVHGVCHEKVILLKKFDKLPVRGKADVFSIEHIPQNIALDEELQRILLKGLKDNSVEIDKERVKELNHVLYAVITVDGFEKYLSGFSGAEIKEALTNIKEGMK